MFRSSAFTRKYLLHTPSSFLHQQQTCALAQSVLRTYATDDNNNSGGRGSNSSGRPFASRFNRRGSSGQQQHGHQKSRASHNTGERRSLFSRRSPKDSSSQGGSQKQDGNRTERSPFASFRNSKDASSARPRGFNRMRQGGAQTIRQFDEQHEGRKLTGTAPGDRPAYKGGTGSHGVPTRDRPQMHGKTLFGRSSDTKDQRKPHRVSADLNRDDAKQHVERKSLFSSTGLFGKSNTAPSSDGAGGEGARARRPLFSRTASPFARQATGPKRGQAPVDDIGKDPSSPVEPAKGIPKTSLYGNMAHDERLKREIEREKLKRERLEERISGLSRNMDIPQRFRRWGDIDTNSMRQDILTQYNKQRYDMLKPLLDLVGEVDKLEQQSKATKKKDIDSMELQSLDDEVHGFLDKNPQLKMFTQKRINPWDIIENPKMASKVLTEEGLKRNNFELLEKVDRELNDDPSTKQTVDSIIDLKKVRANKRDYEAYQLATHLINTNVLPEDPAKTEWEELKEDMMRVLNLNSRTMKEFSLTNDPHELSTFSQQPNDELQDKAKSFVDMLRDTKQSKELSALEQYKLQQSQEESLVKALKSKDKIAFMSDPHGGTVIGLNNHILVYEAQMRQIIRDHNRRLRLLRQAREKYAKQFERVSIPDTAPYVHVSRLTGRKPQAPLYKYVERLVDRVPESLAKRRLASHSRVIMKNKYLTMDEKKTMVGNLSQVYQKYRLHLHMQDADPKPINTSHIHGEILRVG